MENKTLTDEIYAELVDGLKTGSLNWTHFLAKHSTSKGPLYNAIGRFFHDMEPKVGALNEVQAKLDQAGLKLDSLDQRIKETESSLVPLEKRKDTLNEQLETLQAKVAEKSELLEHVGELDKLGFNIEILRQLKDALTEIGAKQGLKGKRAITKFFSDLQDYDARIGFEQEIRRLETIAGTKKLEAEKWQAEADSLAKHHKDLSEAITTIQSLLKHGVKAEQIVSWNNTLTTIGGVDQLEKGLGRYKSVQELLAAKRREQKQLDTKLAKANGAVKTLKEQKVELEGSIKALRASAIAEIERLSQTALETLRAQKAEIEGSIKTLKTSALNEMKEVSQTGVEKIGKVAQAGSDSLRQTGQTALSELKLALSLVDDVSDRALEVGKIIGQIESKLDESKETKKKAEALVARIEAQR